MNNGKSRIIFYICLSLICFVGIPILIQLSKSPSALRSDDARAAALKMSGIKFDVVPGEEGKISTELAIFDPATKNWFPLVPCTAEQQALKNGDTVTFHYRDKELGKAAEPMAEKFCHLEIF